MATGILDSWTSLAAPVEILLLSFSLCISLSEKFPLGPCLGHRPSPFAVFDRQSCESCMGRGRAASSKVGVPSRQNICWWHSGLSAFGLPYLSLLGASLLGIMPELKWAPCCHSIDSQRGTITCCCLVTIVQTTWFSGSMGWAQTPALFWQCCFEKWPGYVPGSGLSLPN